MKIVQSYDDQIQGAMIKKNCFDYIIWRRDYFEF